MGWWRRRGNLPGTSQAIETASAMATLKPQVTEGECCSRKRRQPPHLRERESMTATLQDTTQISSLPSQAFSARHIGPQLDDREKMLAALGLASLEELVDQSLPQSIRSTKPLQLPPALSEWETLAELRGLASRNRPLTSMIGLGYHGTITPSVI